MTPYDVDMASGRRTILLVEDEPAIAEPLAETLTREGFHLEVAGTAADAVDAAGRIRPDLILLDLMLPDGSGFDVCREVRRESQVPIIMLTARGDEADRVIGLELGADDYVVKPFSAREVTARVRAVLRRTAVAQAPAPGAPDPTAAVEVGDVRLDPATRSVTRAGEPVEVTRKEFDLLALLMRSAGVGRHARAPHRRGLGRQLVRVDEDARRPRQRPAQEARRRLRRPALHPHRPRRRLHVRRRRGRGRGGAMSVRVWQLAAFAYVLVLMLVALEVPLER